MECGWDRLLPSLVVLANIDPVHGNNYSAIGWEISRQTRQVGMKTSSVAKSVYTATNCGVYMQFTVWQLILPTNFTKPRYFCHCTNKFELFWLQRFQSQGTIKSYKIVHLFGFAKSNLILDAWKIMIFSV